jgi:biopolymer transport protein TolR
MAFSMAGGGPSRPEINVTPLIDVLLVLIIVFMVIVATTKEYKVDALLPQPGNQEPVPWEQLEPNLERIFLGRAEKVVYVKGDESLDFEYVAQVVAEAHNAGIKRVALLTKDLD